MLLLFGYGNLLAKTSIRFFFWLLLKDRLSTRELLRRRNMELPDYNCVHCNTPTEETLEHLFLHCPFAHNCWASINLFVGNSNPFVTLEQFRDQLNVPFFMDVIIVMSWCIWMQRNDLIFRGILPSQAACLRHFKSEFALVILWAKARYKDQMSLWLEALV